VSIYSACLWLALRWYPATETNGHGFLLTLCVAMAIHHGIHLYVLAIAAFEAKRVALIRVESMRVLSEQRKLEAEQALHEARVANAERIEMEKAMHEAQRRESLGLLAGGIAHDFNNLLTVILGNVDLSRVEPRISPVLEERLDTITSAVERAAQLTRQLLVYSGKARAKNTSVDLGAHIQGAARLFRPLLKPEVTLNLHGQAEGIKVEADAALLDQVIFNIVQNAVEAC